MELDAQRIYKALDGLHEKVGEVLIHQKEQNGKVDRNAECIASNQRLLETHAGLLMDHGQRIVRLETGEEVEAGWQRQFRADTKQELDWSRDRIIDLLVKVLPWIGLLGLLGKDLLY